MYWLIQKHYYFIVRKCMNIGIIGGGWYGIHIALTLAKLGHTVTIYEKNADILSQLSGNFGIRLHAGPHYPRSEQTRKTCHGGSEEFIEEYPELVIEHESSIYGLGIIDAEGQSSKVERPEFEAVCHETPGTRVINIDEQGFHNLQTAMNVNEPSIAVGERLREGLKKRLREAGVRVVCNYDVKDLKKENDQTVISDGANSESFDYIVNATSYQSLPPKHAPAEMNVVYQPAVILLYEDTQPGEKPISFTVMDGWYPCLMPYIDNEDNSGTRKYALYHSKYGIMGSFKTLEEARQQIAEINAAFVEEKIKPKCEQHMAEFWPEFLPNPDPNTTEPQPQRFRFIGYRSEVIAKMKTEREFRSAVTFESDGVIYIFPGKVNNIFDAAREVVSLIENQNVLEKDGYRYIKGGVLNNAIGEIVEQPIRADRNTCELQTMQQLRDIAPNPHGFWEKPLPGDNTQPATTKTPSI